MSDLDKILIGLEVAVDAVPAVLLILDALTKMYPGKVTLEQAQDLLARFPHPDELEKKVREEMGVEDREEVEVNGNG